MEVIMAGGMKITDKGGWPGSSSEMMKSSNRLKDYSSAEGAGELNQYFDTSEKIKEVQVMGEKKVKSYAPKPGYRN
jgi:hypothetical protein